MANNRMFLVNDADKVFVTLAKYSPSQGWGIWHPLEDVEDAIEETTVHNLWGEVPRWRLVYETDDDFPHIHATYTRFKPLRTR